MSNTDRFSLLERWADGMEKLEQYYEGIYGPPATPPSLPPITTYDAMLEAIADGMERAKRNINKKSPTYHSDSVAYVKTVPSGDVHYASLEQIGGKTVVFNQLEKSDATTETVSEVTFTNNSGEWTVNGTATASITKNVGLANVLLTQGHKYILRGCPSGGSDASYKLSLASVTTDYGSGSLFTWSNADNVSQIRIMVASGYEASSLVFRPQYVDLTLMYGAGNEPTTVAEFQQRFPAQYYPYNAGTLLSAGVTSVISKKADTTEIATYSIPAEIRALEGYGWSVQVYTNNVYSGDVYNQIDFENKKYTQNVGKVTLNGSESWTWDSNNALGYTIISNGIITDATTQTNTYVLSNNPAITSTSWGRRSMYTYTMGMYYGQTRLYCKSSNFTSANDVKTYFTNNPTDVNYVLQNPVETDISAYLTDDNLIEVEAGGTLTFENQNGDDYRIPVPSTETFIVGEP